MLLIVARQDSVLPEIKKYWILSLYLKLVIMLWWKYGPLNKKAQYKPKLHHRRLLHWFYVRIFQTWKKCKFWKMDECGSLHTVTNKQKEQAMIALQEMTVFNSLYGYQVAELICKMLIPFFIFLFWRITMLIIILALFILWCLFVLLKGHLFNSIQCSFISKIL